jgi:hypothetical protein
MAAVHAQRSAPGLDARSIAESTTAEQQPWCEQSHTPAASVVALNPRPDSPRLCAALDQRLNDFSRELCGGATSEDGFDVAVDLWRWLDAEGDDVRHVSVANSVNR